MLSSPSLRISSVSVHLFLLVTLKHQGSDHASPAYHPATCSKPPWSPVSSDWSPGFPLSAFSLFSARQPEGACRNLSPGMLPLNSEPSGGSPSQEEPTRPCAVCPPGSHVPPLLRSPLFIADSHVHRTCSHLRLLALPFSSGLPSWHLLSATFPIWPPDLKLQSLPHLGSFQSLAT